MINILLILVATPHSVCCQPSKGFSVVARHFPFRLSGSRYTKLHTYTLKARYL